MGQLTGEAHRNEWSTKIIRLHTLLKNTLPIFPIPVPTRLAARSALLSGRGVALRCVPSDVKAANGGDISRTIVDIDGGHG
jgi:hypothetical protein